MAVAIASGTTQADSADIVVAAGAPVTVYLNNAAGGTMPSGVVALVQVKSAVPSYTTVGQLSRECPALVIDGPGTYRVRRLPCDVAIAVDQS